MQVLAAATIPARQETAGSIAIQSLASPMIQTQNEKLTEARNAVAVLKQVAVSKSDGQKNAARQKLELLRQQFEKMRLLGATPRQLAQMAEELARAVKDYAAAGGTPSETGSAPAAAGAASKTDQTEASEPGETQPGSRSTKAETEITRPFQPISISNEPGSTTDKIKSDDGRRTLTQYEQTLRSHAEGRHSVKTPGVDDGDRVFYAAARLLAKQIKEAAQQAAKSGSGGQDHGGATRAVDVAARSVDEADALGHGGGVSFSV